MSRIAEPAPVEVAYTDGEFLATASDIRAILAVKGVAYVELEHVHRTWNNLAALPVADNIQPAWSSGYTSSSGYPSHPVAGDNAVRDADTATSGNQQMTILFAAGNDGSGASTVGDPGTGKNVITVGATGNVRSGSYIPSNDAATAGANTATASAYRTSGRMTMGTWRKEG